MMEEEIKEKNYSVSLHKVMSRLSYEGTVPHPAIRITESDAFYYKKEDIDGCMKRYVQPPMSQLETCEGRTPLQDAQVVLISAPGATGKTAMSQYLSYSLNIPIFDLGNYAAVGANTIVGLLMKEVQPEDVFKYQSGLTSSQYSLIIDGLDEASIKVTQEGFEAFLKDVVFFCKGIYRLVICDLGKTRSYGRCVNDT